MWEYFGAIEAEFQRDYHINLVTDINKMTWRRFVILLNHLKPDGVLAQLIRLEQDRNEKIAEENKEVTPQEIMSLFH